ncbi:YczE/YyaS/YitT family protein [Arthrobacter castelli]|uniref:membrane protein YczE n=1 Tax=Arthrobacter castelli TaxID=271431 RepID=UPI000685B235|nr:membrane protein [Arthrobacter castelli]
MQAILVSGHLGVRLGRLFTGLFLYGTAIALMIRASLGSSPWDVFGQGVSRTVGISFGAATIAISATVLLLWIPLKQRPGFGTVANAVLVGIFADLAMLVLDTPSPLLLQAAMFLAGLLMLALASALYIGAGMGPGPRDGLMTGLVRVTGAPVWVVRTSLELLVVIVGWSLGGVVGIGTVVFAVFIGPLVQQALKLLSVELDKPPRRTAAPN